MILEVTSISFTDDPYSFFYITTAISFPVPLYTTIYFQRKSEQGDNLE